MQADGGKAGSGSVAVRTTGDAVVLTVSGAWLTGARLPVFAEVEQSLGGGSRVWLEDGGLASWDSSLLVFLSKLCQECRRRNLELDLEGLPAGIRRLLRLAEPTVAEAIEPRQEAGFLRSLGEGFLGRAEWARESVEFIGELTLALLRFLVGRARLRATDLGYFLHECGSAALPIVSLISLLVGMILAFMGAVQLEMFGAELYVANLVGIGMARDMGAMMTAVIMAGRTGASFAARLGTMQVNEEIDALRTLGVSPVEFLVLPRVLALVLMLPLLCCYADLMGILGGGLVSVGMFDVTPMQYFQQTREAVPLSHFTGGLVKAAAYGLVVAITGCHRGLACGRSAAAVGQATTSAVVTAIVWIVVWCAILTFIYTVIGV